MMLTGLLCMCLALFRENFFYLDLSLFKVQDSESLVTEYHPWSLMGEVLILHGALWQQAWREVQGSLLLFQSLTYSSNGSNRLMFDHSRWDESMARDFKCLTWIFRPALMAFLSTTLRRDPSYQYEDVPTCMMIDCVFNNWMMNFEPRSCSRFSATGAGPVVG